MSEPYEVLFGRNTFDMFVANAGPNHPMTSLIKIVATSNPDSLTWANVTGITGEIAKQVRYLKQEDGPLLQVHGS